MARKGIRPGFQSAFASGCVTPAQVLDFHRQAFGLARMKDGGDGGDGAGADAGSDGGGEGGDGAGSSGSDADKGFPADTPLAEMTAEQREAYWKDKARKHETAAKARADYDAIKAERDQLRAAGMSESERAIEQARTEAREAAKAEARNEFAGLLVAARLEAALAGRMPAEKIASQVEFLDTAKFLTESGEVDTDKVKQYADGLVPDGKQWPDMGQGRRGSTKPAKGVAAGAEMFAASRGKKTES